MNRRVTLSCLSCLIGLTALATALSACNTTKGVGQDVKAAGQGISNSAEKHGAN